MLRCEVLRWCHVCLRFYLASEVVVLLDLVLEVVLTRAVARLRHLGRSDHIIDLVESVCKARSTSEVVSGAIS